MSRFLSAAENVVGLVSSRMLLSPSQAQVGAQILPPSLLFVLLVSLLGCRSIRQPEGAETEPSTDEPTENTLAAGNADQGAGQDFVEMLIHAVPSSFVSIVTPGARRSAAWHPSSEYHTAAGII
jgi:hypothetical protein